MLTLCLATIPVCCFVFAVYPRLWSPHFFVFRCSGNKPLGYKLLQKCTSADPTIPEAWFCHAKWSFEDKTAATSEVTAVLYRSYHCQLRRFMSAATAASATAVSIVAR